MTYRCIITVLLVVALAGVALAVEPASQGATKPPVVAFDTYEGHFVSNKFQPDQAESFVVLKDRKAFDQVFGTALVMGKVAHYLPDDAFDTKIVVAVIKRGKAVWKFQAKDVVVENTVLTVRYTVTSEKSDTAEFACPLIVSVPKGDYTAVVFEEDGKAVGRVESK